MPATAARAARVVEPYDAARAQVYEDSAIAAMNWAEANLPGYAASNGFVNNARNLAAAELYQITGETQWHDLFLATTSYDGGSIAWNEHQYEATVVYQATADDGLAIDADTLNLARADLINRANYLTTTGDRGAFGQIMNPHTPYGYAYTSSTPADASEILVRAHMLTNDPVYFDAIIGDTQVCAWRQS